MNLWKFTYTFKNVYVRIKVMNYNDTNNECYHQKCLHAHAI